MSEKSGASIPQPAAAFGYAGALPFIIAAVALWAMQGEADRLSETQSHVVAMLTGLGTILLSFMGGVRWGLAMQSENGPTFGQLTISVAPALVAWLAFFLEFLWTDAGLTAVVQLVMLILAFGFLLVADLGATKRGEAPAWYAGLRIPLTLLVEASLIAALVKIVL